MSVTPRLLFLSSQPEEGGGYKPSHEFALFGEPAKMLSNNSRRVVLLGSRR